MRRKVSKKRNTAVIILITLVFAAFIFKLWDIQVVSAGNARQAAVKGVEIDVEPVRGEILDSDGNTLATSRQVRTVIFNYFTFPSSGESEKRNQIISELITLFDRAGAKWIDELPIKVNKKGELVFAKGKENEVSYLRSAAFLDLNPYATVENCFDALVRKYSLENFPLREARNIASVYYSMVKDGFNSSTPYVFAKDISASLASDIKEKSDVFIGVDVQVKSEREYPDGTLAAHLLGIVGSISAEEYEAKKEDGYSLNDTIGKNGIEYTYESNLRGEKGKKRIISDSDGNTTEKYISFPKNGDTVILTIRKDIQKTAQDALKIQPRDLLQLLRRHAQLREAGEKVRDLPRIRQPGGPGRRVPVVQKLHEIKAAAHVVHAHHLRHVGGVQGQTADRLLLRRLADEAGVGVQPHHAVRVPDGPELVVRQVPGRVAQRPGIGMGRDEGRGRQLRYVPEARLVQVGNVQQHPLLLKPPDRPPPCGGQPPCLAGQRPRRQRVGLVPREHGVARAEVVILVDTGQRIARVGHALHAHERVKHPVPPRTVHLRAGAHQLQCAVPGTLRPDAVHDLVGPLPTVRVIGRVHPDDENAALCAAPAQAVQMAPPENVRLAPQPPDGHIVENIRMGIEIHCAPPSPRAAPARSVLPIK